MKEDIPTITVNFEVVKVCSGERKLDKTWKFEMDQEMVNLHYFDMPWYRLDKLGWPIETYKGKPFKSFIRIVCQNIRKITG